jgi:uncharacterized membrane protein HdeD (DUF308 family)
MPQEFHVGHHSTLVSTMGWLLMALGLLGLAVSLWAATPASLALGALWSLAALACGHALWRRLEWGRRGAAWLLASLLPALLLGHWLLDEPLPLLALLPASAALALALTWALGRLNSRGVRQEFA